MQIEARKDEAWLFETPPEPRTNGLTTLPYTPLLGTGQTFASLYFFCASDLYIKTTLSHSTTHPRQSERCMHCAHGWLAGWGFPAILLVL
ncbi:hypothetical protein CGRA01v4_06334 [Colletotrichum graminicola]|nr:hypothetical protein CGRA01v4_06334 [Colletotrichum graminicola]